MKKRLGKLQFLLLAVVVLINTIQLRAQTLTIDINEASKGPNPGMIMINHRLPIERKAEA